MRIVACSLFLDVTFSSPFKWVTAQMLCKPQEQERLEILYSDSCLLNCSAVNFHL